MGNFLWLFLLMTNDFFGVAPTIIGVFYPKKVVDLSKKEIVGVEVTTWENPINT